MPDFGTSKGAATVLVVGLDPQSMGLVRECLGTEAAIPGDITPFSAAADAARRQRPQVVVVGFDADADAATRLAASLKADLPAVQLVAHATFADPERIRAAMRAGFQDFVVLPEDGELLRRIVREAPRERVTISDQGKVIAVIGAKGGCGATFLSVNLAAELVPVHRTVVVDMDFSMGDVASFLDLQTAATMSDLLANLSRLDERLLAGSVGVHNSGVHVISQPLELNESEHIRGEDVLRILSAAADAYQYLLVDCGGRLDTATHTAATVADLILLVCTPDVPSVKNAWRRLHLLERQGVDLDRVRLVINRWHRNTPLTEGDIESNLGTPIAATVANDPVRCQHAVNAGSLLRDVDKRSPAARDISGLVSLITDGERRVVPIASYKPFGWLFK